MEDGESNAMDSDQRCTAANEECTTNATLLRKTKPRGYVDDTPARLTELEQKLEVLQEQSQSAAKREEQLKIQLLQREEELALLKKHARCGEPRRFEQQSSTVHPETTLRELRQQSDPVLGHIGQMLLNEKGQEQFLGAHTGVHFLFSATRQSRESLGNHNVCPNTVFGAFFSRLPYPVFSQTDAVIELAESLRSSGLHYYVEQVRLFCEDWNGLYPIVDLDCMKETLSATLLQQTQKEKLSEFECCTLFQLHGVLAINGITHDVRPEEVQVHDAALASLFPYICEVSNIESLRGLILYTIVLQLEGRSQLALQTNGIIVRLAQSLGLHRHSRRFKHEPSEIERRRRLWWCVFICDTNTSINRGLPRLVRPADIDVDLSMNTDCPDHSIQQLPVIIPGEAASPLGLFRQYISLYQIISETLDQLYTTWNRRGGVAKIRGLETKLDSWMRTLEFNWDRLTLNGGTTGSESFALVRLKVLAEFARLLIHRPALSFEQSEPQFHDSVVISVQTAEKLLTAIRESQSPRRLIQSWPLSIPVLLQIGMMFMYPFWLQDLPVPLEHHTLRGRVDAVCEMIYVSADSATVRVNIGDGTSNGIGREICQYLKALCDKTIDTYEACAENADEMRNRASSSQHMGALEAMDYTDWQSLMLPNEFLFSEWDLMQSFGQWNKG